MKRKSITITAIFLLMASLFTTQMHAQLSAGIKAGMNVAGFKSDDDDQESKTGIVLGAFTAYSLTPKFDLQAELMFSQQGAKEGSGSYNFNYIVLPVIAKFSVWNNLYVSSGPQFGFLGSAKTKEDGEKEDIRDNVKSSDLSWIFGAGYQFKQGFVADMRFIPGLSDISDNSARIKNTVFQLTIGYRIGKRK